MTRILYCANCNSYHTIKWANYMANAGYDVHVASLEEPNSDTGTPSGITFHWLKNSSMSTSSEIRKLSYLTTFAKARKLIEELEPDIIHAHRVPSYGLVCSFACGKRPYYLSVWGSDIYDFPNNGPLHRAITKRSLRKCTWLMSTSKAMAVETMKYVDKKIDITPFGVNMELFKPIRREQHQGIVIGTVKSLEKKYGIETLLRACSKLHDMRPDLGISVRIAGRGSQEAELRELASKLGMDSYLTWLGFISQEEAAREWASFDIAVVVSESESFGVSAVEAQACGTPLIITDIPGLMEACNQGKSVCVVERRDVDGLSRVIEQLADNPALRSAMAVEARAYVEQEYEINHCFKRVEEIYKANIESLRGA